MSEASMTPAEVGADLKARLVRERKELESSIAALKTDLMEFPSSKAEIQPRLDTAESNLKRVMGALGLRETKSDGGMARGKGNKMYQHTYATGGSVVDHLSMAGGGMSNSSMAGGGPKALQSVSSANEGLKKLPTHVRNRMGYMKKGGAVKRRAK